jgi:hypothetical protein
MDFYCDALMYFHSGVDMIAWLIIPILAAISIELERMINAITERILGRGREPAKPLEPGQSVS